MALGRHSHIPEQGRYAGPLVCVFDWRSCLGLPERWPVAIRPDLQFIAWFAVIATIPLTWVTRFSDSVALELVDLLYVVWLGELD